MKYIPKKTMTYFRDIRSVILYGLILALLIFVLKWLQWKFLILENAIDIYIGLIAVFFTGLGIWLAVQLGKMKTRVIEKEILVRQSQEFVLNEVELTKLNLSSREYEVLQLIAQGCSNADMAAKLFLSVSTIKTHVSNLFVKMEVRSRTQAIDKAKTLNIIA